MNPTERQPEKSNYSHKEILKKLRSGKKGNSGTQPVRIKVIKDEKGQDVVTEVRRRRKRRTRQPKKIRERRIKLLKRTLLISSITGLLLLVVVYMLILSRIRGQRFRSAVGERVSELLEVGVGFGSFQLNGLNLDNSKAVIKDVPGSLFQGAEMTSLKARVKPWTVFSRDWHLGPVHVDEGHFRFGVSEPVGKAAVAGEQRTPERRMMTAAGFGLDSNPGMITYSGIRIGDCNLYWQQEGLETEPFIGGSVANIGEIIGGSFMLRFRGGQFEVPDWPAFEIENLEGEVSNGTYTIRKSTLAHAGKGSVALSGFVNAGGKGDFHLVAPFSDLPLSDNVHPFWSDKLRGEIDGQVEITGVLGKTGSLLAEGAFSSHNMVFSNNSISQRLAIGLGEALLARIEFHSIEGRLRRTADVFEIYDINARHPALLRLRGSITVHADGRLGGRLEVGVPGIFLREMELDKSSIFGEEVQGFVWATVALGGFIDAPEEDLTPRLEKIRAGILKGNRKLLPKAEIPGSSRK
ncbi:MAG: hypothetical protein VCA55_16825 [Verrucomicrobiales bacterium]